MIRFQALFLFICVTPMLNAIMSNNVFQLRWPHFKRTWNENALFPDDLM